jgi:hypothetical protein
MLSTNYRDDPLERVYRGLAALTDTELEAGVGRLDLSAALLLRAMRIAEEDDITRTSLALILLRRAAELDPDAVAARRLDQ